MGYSVSVYISTDYCVLMPSRGSWSAYYPAVHDAYNLTMMDFILVYYLSSGI